MKSINIQNILCYDSFTTSLTSGVGMWCGGVLDREREKRYKHKQKKEERGEESDGTSSDLVFTSGCKEEIQEERKERKKQRKEECNLLC